MKRMILATTYNSYVQALKGIAKGLNSDPKFKAEGKIAIVNESHRCVDVRNANDRTIIYEQRYPADAGEQPATRGKFVKVGDGEGNYILTTSEYNRKLFKDEDILIKHIQQ